MPAVSVLLPICAGGSPLNHSIASLLRQTCTDFEIVAVVDGSQLLFAQLDRWATRDRRVRVIPGPGAGLVAALERARAAARSPLLMRQDADDLSHPDRMTWQREHCRAHADALVGTHVQFFPRRAVGAGLAHYQAWLNGCMTRADIEREAFVENPIAHPSWMISAEALSAIGGYRDPGWAEDYDVVLRLHERGHALGIVPRVLVAIRQHPERTTWRDQRCSLSAFFRCKAQFLARGPIRERAFAIWGAGQAGGMLGRALQSLGRQPEFFVDIDPRKMGGTKCGVRVVAPDALRRRDPPFVLAAVGTRGARPILRRRLAGEFGLRERIDFLITA